MSNKTKNKANDTNDTKFTKGLECTSAATTYLENPNTGAFSMTQANGNEYNFDVELAFQPSTQKGKQEAIMLKTAEMLQAYNGVTKGYFTMVSSLAVMIGNNYFKELKGIKTPNEFLTKVIGVSKSHASEMTKVAKTFYTSLGKLKDEELGLFNYTELVLLANKDESIVEDVINMIKATEKHTRADVVNAIEKATQKALGVETEETEESADTTEESADTNEESADNTNNESSAPNLTINYKVAYETAYTSLVKIADIESLEDMKRAIEDLIFELATYASDKAEQ